MPRSLRAALLAATGFLFLLALTAAAALFYDRANRDDLLPGVVIGDVKVGGRQAAAVVDLLEDQLPPVGATPLRIVAGQESATVTLGELGLRTDAAEMVAKAQEDARRMGVASRVWHRLFNKPVDRTYEVSLRVDRDAVGQEVAELAQKVEKAPVDARIDTSSGMVSILPAIEGRALDVVATTNRVFEAAGRAANGEARPSNTDIQAPVTALAPEVRDFDDVILIRLAENKLYHYDNGSLLKEYKIATGTARYPTPKGDFSVVLKRRNPTWVNPDPGGWGKSLPARIGPGPRNPLGTRAMNLNAPGIRIHGTSNVSSLGQAASHGCIRMAMSDVEELFDRVEQGTPVAIIQGPPPPPSPPAGAPATPGTPAPAVPGTTFGDPNVPVDLEAG